MGLLEKNCHFLFPKLFRSQELCPPSISHRRYTADFFNTAIAKHRIRKVVTGKPVLSKEFSDDFLVPLKFEKATVQCTTVKYYITSMILSQHSIRITGWKLIISKSVLESISYLSQFLFYFFMPLGESALILSQPFSTFIDI